MRAVALLIFATCMTTTAALAGVTQRTSYQPFVVHGKSAHAIYNSVLSHSHKKDGFRTFATTDVSLRPKIKLVTKPQCKITEAMITARFVVHLPQLANEAALAPSLDQDWTRFVSDLKHHEEHHRDLWLGCAADLASAAKSVAATDCKSFARQFENRIKAASRSCRARNDAFDETAQIQLPRIPFVRRALAGK